jgi:hypothetical protein
MPIVASVPAVASFLKYFIAPQSSASTGIIHNCYFRRQTHVFIVCQLPALNCCCAPHVSHELQLLLPLI